MAEMGFQAGDDTDVGSLFPKDVKLTASDFISGIVFDDESDDSESTPHYNNNNNYNTARKRTKDFFRKYIDDVYNGKEGNYTAVQAFLLCNSSKQYADAVVKSIFCGYNVDFLSPEAWYSTPNAALSIRRKGSIRRFVKSLQNAWVYSIVIMRPSHIMAYRVSNGFFGASFVVLLTFLGATTCKPTYGCW